ncbi:hypothetical protein [Pseudonocardia xinjiangensis]|uniref:Uncharacterized protein n=1 Tax=Pseudonocardia xinjiangensis TaxID=75289 RepID=A0ABX1RA20_9PSEU|nr:hypothetical protein [Pseudonocardia xinjiangensis]NMH77233.1 hypothetical protein [Pseudonocardia xinjiangensis]
MRQVGEVDVYFVANTGPYPQALTLGPRDAADGGVPLHLQPYEAAVVVGLPAPDQDVPAAPADGPADAVELAGPWTVAYADAPGERTAVVLPHRWEDDPGRADYCQLRGLRVRPGCDAPYWGSIPGLMDVIPNGQA